MTKLYKNYIIWTGDNPRLLDIVPSKFDPTNEIYPSAAGTWWETIRQYYATLVGDGYSGNCMVTGEEDYIDDLRNHGVFPSP